MKTKLAALVLLLCLGFFSTACDRIGPGYVGIKVSNAGDNRGVSDIPTTTGWVIYNPMLSSVYEWPTFTQQVNLAGSDAISFQSESMTITAPVGFSYSLEAEKVPHFFVKFRTDNLNNFTHGYLKNLVRDKFNEQASKRTIDQIMGDNKSFLADVKKSIQESVAVYGVHLEDQFGFTGALELPPQVTASVNAKIQATQNAMTTENQLRQVQAEMAKEKLKAETYAANRLVAAQSEAEANLKVAKSLTPELVEWKKLDKWDGKLSTVSGGSSGVILNLK